MVATSSQWRSCTSFLSIVYHAPSVALSLFSGRPCSLASAASRAMAARRRETYGQGAAIEACVLWMICRDFAGEPLTAFFGCDTLDGRGVCFALVIAFGGRCGDGGGREDARGHVVEG